MTRWLRVPQVLGRGPMRALLCFKPGICAGDMPAATKTILVLGDSLTAGYELDPIDAYPALLQKKSRRLTLSLVLGSASDTVLIIETQRYAFYYDVRFSDPDPSGFPPSGDDS